MQFNLRGTTVRALVCAFLVSILGSAKSWAQADPAVGNEPQYTFTKTSTGFYFPTGVSDNPPYHKYGGTWLGRDGLKNNDGTLHDWDGPPAYTEGLYHIGFDIKADFGSAVFAIAAGKVTYRSTNWNNDGTADNVGIGIVHTLNDGSQFVAIYGHIHSGLQIGDIVSGGVEIGTVGHTLNDPAVPGVYVDHLHFGIKPGPDLFAGLVATTLGYMTNDHWPDSATPQQVLANPGAYPNITNGFVDPIAWIKNNTPTCQNGSSERYLPGGQIPFHPDGSIVKLKSSNTAYVLRDNKKFGIPDRNTLNTLYGFGRGFDFQDIITISQQEFDQYPNGGVVTSPLPNNNRNAPDGRLVRQWGSVETSIVTQYNHQDGFRMPFATGSAFLNLGYAECNIAGVSDYTSGYPTPPSGISVENMRGFHATGGVDPNFAISVSASPNSPSPGQSTMVTVTVTNNGGPANDRIIDVEIFDSTSSRVSQQVFEHQYFNGGGPVPYSFTWTPATAGTYTVKVGIFTANWASQDIWNNNALSIPVGSSTLPPGPYQLDIWWPTDGAQISGTQQPFKALIENLALSNYVLYWQVDSGGLNLMQDSNVDAPHKEYIVDVTGWTWRGNGPYTVNFVAKDLNGNILVQRAVNVTVAH